MQADDSWDIIRKPGYPVTALSVENTGEIRNKKPGMKTIYEGLSIRVFQ